MLKKRCSKCGEEKPRTTKFFYIRSDNGGFRADCKLCIKIHKPRPLSEALFWAKVEKSEGCWVWKGSTGIRGHGQVRRFGKQVGAHRYSWILKNGEVPDGLCVLHKCDNPPCVNPDHLFLGTKTENSADMVRKNRQRKKLQPEQVVEIRRIFSSGECTNKCQIARMFNVHPSAIGYIIHRKVWKLL